MTDHPVSGMRERVSDERVRLLQRYSTGEVRDLCVAVLDARTELTSLRAVAEAAREVEALEHDVALKSAIENDRLKRGETVTMYVGGTHPLTVARQKLHAALDAVPRMIVQEDGDG